MHQLLKMGQLDLNNQNSSVAMTEPNGLIIPFKVLSLETAHLKESLKQNFHMLGVVILFTIERSDRI